jgi:AraC-like DNA-binding protein
MGTNYLFYRESNAPAEIAHLVWSFWEFRVRADAPGPLVHEVFPDGCVSLLYFCNKKFGYDGLAFTPLSLKTIVTEVYPGSFCWGMRLAPAACSEILRYNSGDRGAPAAIALDSPGAAPHLTAGLAEKLRSCKDFDEAMKVFCGLIAGIDISSERIDDKIAEAVNIIENSNGEIKIADIAKTLALSARQFERRFRKCAGLTAKQFARARRMRAAAVSVVENDKLSWADRAAENGFTDQSHLNHEFISLTGRSPNSFAEKVSKIEHGNLI